MPSIYRTNWKSWQEHQLQHSYTRKCEIKSRRYAALLLVQEKLLILHHHSKMRYCMHTPERVTGFVEEEDSMRQIRTIQREGEQKMSENRNIGVTRTKANRRCRKSNKLARNKAKVLHLRLARSYGTGLSSEEIR